MTETNGPEPDLRFEEPEADAAEQRAALREDEDAPVLPSHLPLDANEADATEQSLEVEFDEDEYR
ncbi:hypothetical protein Arub01_05460 [Actinomadura rubrobrunea]|uniref:DUF5709 domain-containing protein n=1 Tax=Actinomadura rubrobrunea TaxID=115335 RepID=A0A9W6PRV3_9ACTN|nr:hypothetical protein [Actinomadura rubrobrunea]GLW62302.1 hypothetical protein Arub01_05460 [Actinomadura rubrobrunea]